MPLYHCVHCLAVLLVDDDGQIQPCPAHPDGAVDLISNHDDKNDEDNDDDDE